jgi:two-component system phosphate regulon sensor histidine kinase PhoR
LPGGISISVEDNGIGISRSDQQKVFEKFYRVSQGDVHNIKGFGLGLSNVKEITELHGGLVQLRSETGKGTTFTLFFPFKTNGDE